MPPPKLAKPHYQSDVPKLMPLLLPNVLKKNVIPLKDGLKMPKPEIVNVSLTNGRKKLKLMLLRPHQLKLKLNVLIVLKPVLMDQPAQLMELLVPPPNQKLNVKMLLKKMPDVSPVLKMLLIPAKSLVQNVMMIKT